MVIQLLKKIKVIRHWKNIFNVLKEKGKTTANPEFYAQQKYPLEMTPK